MALKINSFKFIFLTKEREKKSIREHTKHKIKFNSFKIAVQSITATKKEKRAREREWETERRRGF